MRFMSESPIGSESPGLVYNTRAVDPGQDGNIKKFPKGKYFYEEQSFTQSLQILSCDKELLYQIVDMLPVPINIFSPDGTIVFVNHASLEMNHVRDANLIIGKYNLLKDPVCNDQMGLREIIQRGFRGETVSCPFLPPIQDLVDRGIINEKPFESAAGEVFLYPVWNREELCFVVCVFIVKALYLGRPEVARAKEYIDSHWHEEFEPVAVAKFVNMSVSQLYNLFKKHTGKTPGDYQKNCKVEHIKEKLADRNLSIKQAFATCGEDSRGWFSRVFKEVTGFSPSEYRKNLA